MKKGVILSLFFLLIAALSLAQAPAKGAALSANVSEAKLESKLMGRVMPYRIVLPRDYSQNKARRYAVVYILHGLTGAYTNWTTAPYGKLGEAAKAFDTILVTPEGANGWYTDSPTTTDAKYESYIIKELIPEIDGKYRTINNRSRRAIAGLSMGGYGSLKFGLKYPEMFSIAGSFSGALFAPKYSPGLLSIFGQALDTPFLQILNKSILDAYGPAGGVTRKENDVFEIVRSLTPESIGALPYLYIDCGTEDFLIQNNRDFAELLFQKKVPHEFRQLPGNHTWPYWNAQVVEFLRLAERLQK